MPGQAADLGGHDRVVPRGTHGLLATEVEDHAGPAVEQPGLDVELGLGRLADGGGRRGEAFVVAIEEVVVEHHPDADAAVGEIGHGTPTLVDTQRPVVARHAASEVLTKGGGRQVEQAAVAGLLVEPHEHERGTR